MPYTTYYTAHFHNDKEQYVEITLSKLNGEPVDIISFEITKCTLTDNSDKQSKYDWLVIRQMEFGLWITDSSPVTFESFIASDYNEWQVRCSIDGQPYFEGFIVPNEGEGAFLPKPYELTIRATNGLALLKNADLSDVDDNPFTGDNSLIAYIAGALKKTGSDLPIRIHCSYFNVSMLNKGDGLERDMFNQSYLDYRTFKKDQKTFVSCHDALRIILENFCLLEYWNGMWQITCLADRQYVPGDRFYVDYDSNGENPVGAQWLENHGQVGADVDIFPCNENQVISSKYAVKSTKTYYDYEVVPSLYNNEGIAELGAIIPGITGDVIDTGDEDNDGDNTEVIGTYQGYELSGWVHKKQFLNEVDPVTDAYIKVERDVYQKDTARYYVVVRDASAPVDPQTLNYIRNANTDYYVRKGDKIDISVTGRLNAGISNIWGACGLVIFAGGDPTDNANYWSLNTFGRFQQAGGGTTLGWAQINGSVVDLSEWQTESLDNCLIPVNGILIVKLQAAFPPGAPTEAHFKSLNITYHIFVGGSYFNSKGDYWLRSQTRSLLNKTEDKVSISDSPRRITKGALIFKNDTVNDLMTPDWYRYYQIGNPNPNSEAKDFKELLNIGRYNDQYRRFYSIEGDFDGLNFAPENGQLIKQPIGFHKTYRFVDMDPARDFVLVAPLTMDLARGEIKATFVEVVNPALLTNHGTEMDQVITGLIQAVSINTGGSATLQRFQPNPGMVKLISPAGDIVDSIIADAGGAGNSPSLTLNTQFTEGGNNIAYLTIGEDLAIDNNFYFKVGVFDVYYTVVDIIEQSDGTQIGDSAIFDYTV